MNMKTVLKGILLRTKHWFDEEMVEVPFDNTYPWVGYTFQELMKNPMCSIKPMYLWGVTQGAALAKVLNMASVSVIEFGVAGGAGLLSLETIAELVAARTGINIDVYGFDCGTGLPKPRDYRDQPNMWIEGQLPMLNRESLEKQLRKASLRIGPVKDTVPAFLKEFPSPIAFVCFDLDLYSSTCDALAIFDAEPERLLPRVVCYFDDIMGHTYSDYTGERLAILEFNATHPLRKLSPIYNLRYFAPHQFARGWWWDPLYFAHCFDHPLYNKPDSITKAVYVDDKGNACRLPIDSDWRSQIS